MCFKIYICGKEFHPAVGSNLYILIDWQGKCWYHFMLLLKYIAEYIIHFI